jgi:hypothetical protein
MYPIIIYRAYNQQNPANNWKTHKQIKQTIEVEEDPLSKSVVKRVVASYVKALTS